jgi:hypothetical protein
MNDRDQENLAELLEKFFDAEQAKNCLEDIRKAEQIFRDHPAPEPDDMLIGNIKAEIAMRLPVKRARLLRRRIYEAAGVAAAIVVLAAVSVQLFKNNGGEPKGLVTAGLIPAAIWESDDIAADDASLAIYSAEIEQIEDEVRTLQSGEDTGESDNTIAELEMELIAISSDFWKG